MQQVRPTTALIHLDALRTNLGAIRGLVGRRRHIWAAVKGDAYGHGAVAVVNALETAGCDGFAVALVEEGVRLREAGCKAPILCLGGVQRTGAQEALARGLTPVVFDEGDAERMEAVATGPVPVHLKVDTGMGRLGVPMSQLGGFLDRFARYRHLVVEGLMTHFAESEAMDPTYTLEQARRFQSATQIVRQRGFQPKSRHVCNSGAILTRPELYLDAVRPGIMLYGVAPDSWLRDRLPLQPVMQVTTRVLFVKDLPAGASVSYGRRFVTQRPSRIATLPVGYADGYPRALGNRASVLLQGRRCPVVGTVCMDLCMVDVTDLAEPVEPGDEVVLLGRQGEAEMRAEELAELAGTIPYEILCGFSERVPRVRA